MRAPQVSACIAEVLGTDREPLAIVRARLLDRGRVADDLLIESGQGRSRRLVVPGKPRR